MFEIQSNMYCIWCMVYTYEHVHSTTCIMYIAKMRLLLLIGCVEFFSLSECVGVVVFHRPDIAASVFYIMRLVVDSCIMLLLFLSDKCEPYYFPHKRHLHALTQTRIQMLRIFLSLIHSFFLVLISFAIVCLFVQLFNFINIRQQHRASPSHYSTQSPSIAINITRYTQGHT